MNSLRLFGIGRHLIALCVIWAGALAEESSADGVQLHLTATSHRNASGAWTVSTFASGDVVAVQPPRIHVDAKLNVGNRPHGWVTWLTANATLLVGNDVPGVPDSHLPPSPTSRTNQAPDTASTVAPTAKILSWHPSTSRTTQAPVTASNVAPTAKIFSWHPFTSRTTQAPVTASNVATTEKIFSWFPSTSRTTQAPVTTSNVATTTEKVPNHQASEGSSNPFDFDDEYSYSDNNAIPTASSPADDSVVYVTVQPPSLVSANLVTVLAGYESFDIPGVTSLYRLQTRALTWPEAKAACEAEGAHLIVVNSEAEAQVVKEFFDRNPYLVDAENPIWFAVGLHKHQGRDVTVLGGALEESGYAKWAPNDGQWIQGPEVDCGIMDRRMFFAYEYCGYKRAFICELEGNALRY